MTEPYVCASRLCFSRSRYTGKERDTESGNDYFDARYYSSNLGRFMSPDWSAKEEPIPYAKMHDDENCGFGCQANRKWISDHQITNPTDAQLKAAQMPTNEIQQQQNQIGPSLNGPFRPVTPHFDYLIDGGALFQVDATGDSNLLGIGYSGKGDGLNDPHMEDVQGAKGKDDAGPIPEGHYTIGPIFNNVGKTGPGSMRLMPSGKNEMFGRSGFLIHGDNSHHNFSASEGCIIFGKSVRDKISTSGIHNLEVKGW